MGLKLYLFGLYSAMLVALGLCLLLITNVNPFQAPFWIIAIFYFTFFLFWLAVWSIFGFYLKVWATNREVIFAHLGPTLRQSAFIALVITGLLFLQQIKVLNWWVAGLFVVSIGLVELFFRSRK